MTYKLNPLVKLFCAPVILHFGDGNAPDQYFENGTQLAEEIFDRNYLLEAVSAQNNQIVVTIKENKMINNTEWENESSATNLSFF